MTAREALTLRSRPLPIDIEAATTAVMVVDMQNGFVSPGGSWSLAGVDVGPIDALVPRIASVLEAARRAGMPVVYLTMPLPPSPSPQGMPDFAFGGTGRQRWRHYVDTNATGHTSPVLRDAATSPTWNSDIVADLLPHAGEPVVVKPTFGGFHLTDLEDRLRQAGVDTLLFTGCTTSVCVETTLREAVVRGFRCVLVADCVAEPVGGNLPRTNHDATVLLTELVFGWVIDADAVVSALGEPAAGHRVGSA
jgi:ureidoacrylate peracid hydrolase